VVGPLLGLLGYHLLDQQIAPLLYIAIIPAVASVLLIGLVRVPKRVGPRPARTPMLAGIRELPRHYWRVTAVVVGFGLVNFPDALLLLRLNEIGFGVVEVILAYVAYNLVYAIGSFPAGMLADRLPRSVVFGIGLVFFALCYIGLGLTTDPAAAWLLIAIYGLFAACTDGVGKAWVSSLVGDARQSTAQGVFQGGSGLAILFAGVWAGLLWGADGRLPLLISGVAGGCLSIVLLGRWALLRAR
jgi:MFS family permease